MFQFSCDQCTYKCRAKSALKRRIAIKHKPMSDLPSEPCPPITSSPHIISSRTKVPTLPSITCPPQSSLPNTFIDVCPHLGHTFKCNVCYSIFSSIQSHARHIIDVHPEQTNYECDYCPYYICSYLEVAHEGCDCSCNACEERLK